MGIMLTNDSAGQYLALEQHEWDVLLSTASHHGWESVGTSAPCGWVGSADGATWAGDYLSAESQEVSDSDAEDIASALAQAREEVRLSDTRTERNREAVLVHLQEGIGFLRCGAFRIEASRPWWTRNSIS